MQARRPTVVERLLLHDGFGGAVIDAGAAADADIGIDDVDLVTLRNSLDGAVVDASAALNASLSDPVCHDIPSICVYCASC